MGKNICWRSMLKVKSDFQTNENPPPAAMAVAQPADLPLAITEIELSRSASAGLPQPVCGGSGLVTNLAGAGQRHLKDANYCFADSHVKWS